jgi:hypothetical protein
MAAMQGPLSCEPPGPLLVIVGEHETTCHVFLLHGYPVAVEQLVGACAIAMIAQAQKSKTP